MTAGEVSTNAGVADKTNANSSAGNNRRGRIGIIRGHVLRDRVAIAGIVGRRILIAVSVIEGLIWVVVVRKNEESQIVIEMMKPVMIEIMAAKAATGSNAVVSSEVVTASVRSAAVAAVESTGRAAAASNSTNSAAAVAAPEACCSNTVSRCEENQRGDDYGDERSR